MFVYKNWKLVYNYIILLIEGVNMVRYVCIKCGKVWYTSNTSPDQKCDDCGGLLKASDIYNGKINNRECSNNIQINNMLSQN